VFVGRCPFERLELRVRACGSTISIAAFDDLRRVA